MSAPYFETSPKFESRLIYAMAIVPVLLVIGLTVLLFPDLVFHH